MSGERPLVSSAFNHQSVIASIGMGIAFSAFEAWRSPVFGIIDDAEVLPLRSSYVSIVFLLACCVFYFVSRRRLARSNVVVGLISALSCITLVAYHSASIGAPAPLAYLASMHMAFSVLLLMIRIEELLRMPARKGLGIMGVGLVSAFLVQALVAALNSEIAWMICASLPLFSGFFFHLHRYNLESPIDRFREPNDSSSGHANVRFDIKQLKALAPLFATVLICGLVFGLLNSIWRDDLTSPDHALFIQLATALGSLVAGGILLALKPPIATSVPETLVVVFALAALLAESTIENLPVFLIPLNMAQKFMFILLLVATQSFKDKAFRAFSYCVLFLTYRVGLSLQGEVRALLVETFQLDANVAVTFVAAVGCIALVCLAIREMASTKPLPQPEKEPEGIEFYRKLAFNYYLAQQFELTQRESAVVELLIEGLNSTAIAQKLGISPSTVKTHLHNIYGKAEVHSQAEFLYLVHAKYELFFTLEKH